MQDLDLFRGVVPFVTVAEELSFRRAAIRLGVSPAAVSKAVQTLEASVGVRLLARTPRSVALTREGEAFFDRARAAVAALRGAHDAIEPSRRAPQGELVVSLPFVLTELVATGLSLLHVRFPRLTFQVLVSDALSRLAEEKVDVAVRVGRLTSSSLVARTLRRTSLLTLAAPSYLARRGRPESRDQLATHDCLSVVAPTGKPYPWLFDSGPYTPRPLLTVNHGPMLRDLLLAGLGLGQLFDFMAAPLVREGRLEHVLAHEPSTGPEVHAVCAPGHRVTPRVRAAFEAFTEVFER